MGVAAPPLSTHHPPGEGAVGVLVRDEPLAEQCRQWLEESGLRVLSFGTVESALEAIAAGGATVMLVQGEPHDSGWLPFMRRAAETRSSSLISLLDESISPRLRADLDELPGHRSLRRPLERLALRQALALSELEGLDLRAVR
jgi:hypothetical protein